MHKGPLPDDDGTLVYSHVDLAMRNLIVGQDGQLWLIDFMMAGFYPRWFEYVNMVIDAMLERGAEYDSIWWVIIPFVVDPYFCIYDWIETIAPDCLYRRITVSFVSFIAIFSNEDHHLMSVVIIL